MRHWTGALIRTRKIEDLAKHHIFPSDFLRKSEIVPDDPREKGIFISGLGNITFINKEINSEIRDTPPKEYLDDYKQTIEKHFIPTKSSLWRLENFEEFKKVRVHKMYLAMKEYFPRVFK